MKAGISSETRGIERLLEQGARAARIVGRFENTFDGSSGMKWAMASSSWFTLSTKRFLNVPVGVSMIVPMGTR
ncbi:hypothetical protein NE553_15675, partial [Eggerthella lenta]|nr:hypothetical protein [Eggerthella lenta]